MLKLTNMTRSLYSFIWMCDWTQQWICDKEDEHQQAVHAQKLLEKENNKISERVLNVSVIAYLCKNKKEVYTENSSKVDKSIRTMRSYRCFVVRAEPDTNSNDRNTLQNYQICISKFKWNIFGEFCQRTEFEEWKKVRICFKEEISTKQYIFFEWQLIV